MHSPRVRPLRPLDKLLGNSCAMSRHLCSECCVAICVDYRTESVDMLCSNRSFDTSLMSMSNSDVNIELWCQYRTLMSISNSDVNTELWYTGNSASGHSGTRYVEIMECFSPSMPCQPLYPRTCFLNAGAGVSANRLSMSKSYRFLFLLICTWYFICRYTDILYYILRMRQLSLGPIAWLILFQW